MLTKLLIAAVAKVSAFSTWEKELHKIVFDPRYLLLTSKERKQVFEQYVKERAEEERREKRNKLKEKKDLFRQLLEEAKLSSKWVDFVSAVSSSLSIFVQLAVAGLLWNQQLVGIIMVTEWGLFSQQDSREAELV